MTITNQEDKHNTSVIGAEKAKQLKKEISSFMLGTGVASKLNKYQVDLCIKTAFTLGLSPLKREIHFIPYYNVNTGQYDVSIVVGYEVYLKRAARSGKLNGWEIKIDGDPNKPETLIAALTIYRKDWDRPFVYTQTFKEAKQTKKNGELVSMWATKPITMLRKTTISQGFRLCFPDELAGLPYTIEEMPIEQQTTNNLSLPTPEVTSVKSEKKENEKIDQEKKAEEKKEAAKDTNTKIKISKETLEQKLARARAEIEAKKNKTKSDSQYGG